MNGRRNTSEWMLRAFKANGCACCGRRSPEVDWSELHLDHINGGPEVKRAAILSRSPAPAVLDELLRCQPLCRECHKRKHGGPPVLIDGQLELFVGSGVPWEAAA